MVIINNVAEGRVHLVPALNASATATKMVLNNRVHGCHVASEGGQWTMIELCDGDSSGHAHWPAVNDWKQVSTHNSKGFAIEWSLLDNSLNKH